MVEKLFRDRRRDSAYLIKAILMGEIQGSRILLASKMQAERITLKSFKASPVAPQGLKAPRMIQIINLKNLPAKR